MRRIAFPALLTATIGCVAAAYVSATEAIGRFVSTVVAFVLNTLAVDSTWRLPVPALPFTSPRLSYAGPDIDLRHEAHTSRRAAARHT